MLSRQDFEQVFRLGLVICLPQFEQLWNRIPHHRGCSSGFFADGFFLPDIAFDVRRRDSLDREFLLALLNFAAHDFPQNFGLRVSASQNVHLFILLFSKSSVGSSNLSEGAKIAVVFETTYWALPDVPLNITCVARMAAGYEQRV